MDVDEDRLRRALALDLLGEVALADPVAAVATRRRRRRTVLTAAGALAGVAAFAAMAGAATIGGREDPAPQLAGSAGPTGSPAALQGRVGATGRVVAHGSGDVRFCVPFTTLNDTGGAVDDRCGPSVAATGVDLDALAQRHDAGGTVTGAAYLEGVLRNGTLLVASQGPPREDPQPVPLAEPPCAAPAGGWAAVPGESTDALASYQSRYPSDVTASAFFHPVAGVAVLTVASTDTGRTTSGLTASYTGRLCVVKSGYSAAQVTETLAACHAMVEHATHGVYGAALTTTPTGQPEVVVDAVSETDDLREAVHAFPAGLVTIHPWLRSS